MNVNPAAPTLRVVHPSAAPWRILVVDDDPEVHAVTRLALDDFSFENRSLEILCAASAVEAREVWKRETGIALVLLDVVMETDHAGLDFVRFVRDQQADNHVRIVLRTGQPGQAPALEVIRRYEIDDYHTKTELTFQRLTVLVTTALRTYRLLQEMEKQRLALEQVGREVERFAYVISKDLRSPLRTIADFSQMIHAQANAAADVRLQEMLKRLSGGAQQVEALIGDLLEYTRIRRSESGIVRVDLNQVIEDTRRYNQMLIEQRGASLGYGLLPQFEGDPALLERLFAELIKNAIRFQTEPRPQVLIESEDLGSMWEIRVADRGPGIADEHLQHIFEPFRRLYRPDRFSGTGIGLVVCKRIAEVHGGGIAIRTAPGQGTTVAVSLPKLQHHRGSI